MSAAATSGSSLRGPALHAGHLTEPDGVAAASGDSYLDEPGEASTAVAGGSYLGEAARGHYRFRDAARMEWIKLTSLRSTRWALLATVVGMVGIGVITMANTKVPAPGDADLFDPVNNLLAGVALGQLIIGTLGILLVTGEYASGSIRSTFAAIPNRPLLLAAKAGVLGLATLAVGEAVSVGTFFAGRAALATDVPPLALGDPGALRAVLLSGTYLAMIAMIGVALGALMPHAAAAIGTLVGVLFVVPAVLFGLTGTGVAKFFPTPIAANSLTVATPVPEAFAPWAGFGVMCAYTVAVLAVAGWLLTRRDA